LPPIEVVKAAQSHSHQALGLPSQEHFLHVSIQTPNTATTSDLAHSNPFLPSGPPNLPTERPQPHPNSRQRFGESLGDFLTRLDGGKTKKMETESSSERNSRENREVHAARSGYSKTCTVFIWEEAQGFHLRVKVDRREVPDVWNDYPASRRVFHSHINEWDLCPPIPPFSDELTPDDYAEMQRYDDELDAADNVPTLTAPSDRYAGQHSGLMDEIGPTVPFHFTSQLTFDLVDYLKDRHGYDAHRRPAWTPRLHGPPVGSVGDAKKHLLFDSVTHPAHLTESIQNFCNILRNGSLRLHNLSQSWDLQVIQLDIPSLHLSLGTHDVDNERYVVASTAGEASWVLCLHDSTTVLQIYRNRWATLDRIVHELLSRGIAFNTGLPHSNPDPVERSYESTGLGVRLPGYRPRSDDYNSYVAARTELLHSSVGRAAALMGGIIARLARDVVSASDVLSGPSLFSSLPQVAAVGTQLFVDDQLSELQLDIISGVYYVEVRPEHTSHEHLSWWPKHATWFLSGYYSEQWSADAEAWYQTRLSQIRKGEAKLYNSQQWKAELRRYRTHTRILRTGINKLTKDVLDAEICAYRSSGCTKPIR
jgi:hypothetical protein